MGLLVLLVLDAAHIVALKAELERYDTYDIVRYVVEVDPKRLGAAVDCLVTVRIRRDGPVRFLISEAVRQESLAVQRDGQPSRFELTDHWVAGLAKLVPRVQPEAIPRLLRLPRARAGEEITYRFRYLWKPSAKGLSRARKGTIQTHIASGWVPTMLHKFFDVDVRVKSSLPFVASAGKRSQTVCLVVGDYERHRDRKGAFELLVPRAMQVKEAVAQEILADARAIAGFLTKWFGPALPQTFRIVFDSEIQVAYCAREFAVLPTNRIGHRRELRMLLAHEMSHVWWGYRMATPMFGDGGTWLREGLAEWSSIKVMGSLVGPATERALFRRAFQLYFRSLDLRRAKARTGVVFANEATLLDATYAGSPSVPYQRGALVFRMLEHTSGEKRLREALRKLLGHGGDRLVTADDLVKSLGAGDLIRYYAGTTRLPDFELSGGVVRCLDPDWPGANVPCLVDGKMVELDLTKGPAKVAGATIDVDPERIFLDPVRSNNVSGR